MLVVMVVIRQIFFCFRWYYMPNKETKDIKVSKSISFNFLIAQKRNSIKKLLKKVYAF